jgi:hypothetical protein
MSIKETFFVLVFVIIFIYAFTAEFKTRKTIPDLPQCIHVSNYCSLYGKRNNIRYVVKEQIEDESIDILFDRIQHQINKKENIVYWRMSLIISILTVFLIYVFDHLGNKIIPGTMYLFIFMIVWFICYWSRNYLDFHYHDHANHTIVESIKQIKDKLKLSN